MSEGGLLLRGAVLPEIAVEIGHEALVRYAGASDDYVRQHWDLPFMMASGYPDVIVHGWLTMAHMCRVATAAFPAGWTTSSYTVRYLGALHPGLLRCGGAVSDNNGWAAGLALWARDQTGRDVASASLLLSRATNEPGMDWHPLPPGADA